MKKVKQTEAKLISAASWLRQLGAETKPFEVLEVVEETRTPGTGVNIEMEQRRAFELTNALLREIDTFRR